MTNTQDVRYMDAVLLNNTPEEKKDIALVVLKSGRLTGEDTGIKLLDRQLLKRLTKNLKSPQVMSQTFWNLMMPQKE